MLTGHAQWSCSARVCPLPLCLARMLSSLLASLPVPYHVSWSAWEASFPSLIDLSLTTRAEQRVPLPPCLAIALVRIAFLRSKACADVPRAAFIFNHPCLFLLPSERFGMQLFRYHSARNVQLGRLFSVVDLLSVFFRSIRAGS